MIRKRENDIYPIKYAIDFAFQYKAFFPSCILLQMDCHEIAFFIYNFCKTIFTWILAD